MESMLLVRPAPEYAEAIADYRRECLDTGSRMDGCGPLRRMEDPMDWIRYCTSWDTDGPLPEGVDWVDITGEPEGRLFVGITPVQAVARMFHYMDPWRPEVLKEILWSYHLDALKDSYEGSRIRKIGRPFRSGTYCGVYVPVTVERRGGGRERLTIALRNDNPDRVWVVDGGI